MAIPVPTVCEAETWDVVALWPPVLNVSSSVTQETVARAGHGGMDV